MLPDCPPDNPVNAKFPSLTSLCWWKYLQSSVFLSSLHWYKQKMWCQVLQLSSRRQRRSNLPTCWGCWDGKIPGSVCHHWASAPALKDIITSLLVLWRKIKHIWSARFVKSSHIFSQSILNIYNQFLNWKIGQQWSRVKHNKGRVFGMGSSLKKVSD